nr:hypothetical protein [Candidatus Omnitrophota bacterium]
LPGSKLWHIVTQKYFDGLFLIDCSPDGSLQAMVQKFGRNRRQGDIGYVDSIYNIGQGSGFDSLAQEIWGKSSENNSLSPEQKDQDKEKFKDFGKLRKRLGELQKIICNENGGYQKGASEKPEFKEFCEIRDKLNTMLYELRVEKQKREDLKRIRKNDADRKQRLILDKISKMLRDFSEQIEKDPRKAERFLDEVLDRVILSYISSRAVDEEGNIDLTDLYGVLEARFHIKIPGTLRNRLGLQISGLRGAEAGERIKTAREIMKAEMRKLLLAGIGVTRMKAGEIGTLKSGDMEFDVRVVDGKVVIVEARRLSGEGQKISVRVEESGDSIRIGENVYKMEWDSAENTLTGGTLRLKSLKPGKTQFDADAYETQMVFEKGNFTDNNGVQYDTVRDPSAFTKFIELVHGEGYEKLKTEVIAELRKTQGEDLVETDVTPEGLAEAGLKVAEEEYHKKKNGFREYSDPGNLESLRQGMEAVDNVLQSSSRGIKTGIKQADKKASKARKERLNDADNFEAVTEESSIGRSTRDLNVSESQKESIKTAGLLSESSSSGTQTSSDSSSQNVMFSSSESAASQEFSVVDFSGDTLEVDSSVEGVEKEDSSALANEEKQAKISARQKDEERSDAVSKLSLESRPMTIGNSKVKVMIAYLPPDEEGSGQDQTALFNDSVFLMDEVDKETAPTQEETMVVVMPESMRGVSDEELKGIAESIYAKIPAADKTKGPVWVSFEALKPGEVSVSESGELLVLNNFKGLMTYGTKETLLAIKSARNNLRKENRDRGRESTSGNIHARMDFSPSPGDNSIFYTREVGGENFLVTRTPGGVLRIDHLDGGVSARLEDRLHGISAEVESALAGEFEISPDGKLTRIISPDNVIVDVEQLLKENSDALKTEAKGVPFSSSAAEAGVGSPRASGLGRFLNRIGLGFIPRAFKEEKEWMAYRSMRFGGWLRETLGKFSNVRSSKSVGWLARLTAWAGEWILYTVVTVTMDSVTNRNWRNRRLKIMERRMRSAEMRREYTDPAYVEAKYAGELDPERKGLISGLRSSAVVKGKKFSDFISNWASFDGLAALVAKSANGVAIVSALLLRGPGRMRSYLKKRHQKAREARNFPKDGRVTEKVLMERLNPRLTQGVALTNDEATAMANELLGAEARDEDKQEYSRKISN